MAGPIVEISTGKLQGKTSKNHNNGQFYSFQGIPYAKPPIGQLRFKAPETPESWKGIRNATTEGSECFSRHTISNTLVGGEDCLTLNVYTTNLPNEDNNSKLKPVMVWIHGGAFTSGSSKTDIYGPEFLLTEDIVLVTINYRTGILGFLSLKNPELGIPGNAGLKDIVMALQWVQKNISVFSGDPNNVTIFGQSAGGAAAHYLILSPKSKGLFHKAILQSGCALHIWAKGKQNTADLARILGVDATDEKKILILLQSLPVDKLYKVAAKLPFNFFASFVRPHGPVIEQQSPDAFLCEDPVDIIKSGNYNHVPVIIGYTTREGILIETLLKLKPYSPLTNFELTIPNFFNLKKGSDVSKLVAKQIKNFYFGDEESLTSSKDKLYLMETDNFFIRELLRTVKYHIKTARAPIFLYRMSVETSLNFWKNTIEVAASGVCHGDDIGYLFKTCITPEIKPGSFEDVTVRRFVKLWTNFARYGNPNCEEVSSLINVHWKPVTKNELNFLDIGKTLTTGVDPEADRMAFWEKILNNNNCVSKL